MQQKSLTGLKDTWSPYGSVAGVYQLTVAEYFYTMEHVRMKVYACQKILFQRRLQLFPQDDNQHTAPKD
jgi:hypothetical protein